MAFGLNCLVKNIGAIRAIGTAMRSMSDTMIQSDPNVKITAKDLHAKLKKAGVDIDLESAASIYADTFASDINNFSNFETEVELANYSKIYPPVSAEVKKALMDAGYKKTDKNGNEILDWTKLMRKTEDEIKQEIKGQNLPNQYEVFNSLQGEYKQIVSTAIIKAKNDLSKRNTPITARQKNAIDKIADLQVRGLFSDFKDDYNNAMSNAIGADSDQIDAMNEIDNIGKTARMLEASGVGTNNYLGQVLQDQVNKIVSKARYKDASWGYKIVKALSNIVEMANLAILNNLGNRGQNFLSGKVGRINSGLSYGMSPKEIDELASSAKRDVIRNGGVDFGDVNNMFNGDRTTSEKVREWINKLVSKDGQNTAVNWWYAQIMGTAALNGIDNFNKVKNTWVRFISGMEDILVSKGMTKEEASKKLHEEIFGQKWVDARNKAEKIMLGMQQAGSNIKINKESIDRFGADVVKAELINNKIFTEDELNAAWEAGYKSTGLEMGHVANNPLSASLQKLKQNYTDSINKALVEKKYSKAAFEVLKDMFISKIGMRFAGGGTNWIVLKVEKGGLGLFTGLLGRAANHSSYRDRRSLSQMTNTEIEENIYNRQRVNDRLVRGLTGLTTNTALILIASSALGGEEDKERKIRLMAWLKSNKWVNKYVNNWLPFYLSGYLAWQQQKSQGGISEMANPYKSSPARSYVSNLVNKNDDFGLFTGLVKSSSIFSSNEEKKNQGWGELGKTFGNFFNFNPLPYKVPKDVFTITKGLLGPLESYARPTSFKEGYLKYGIFDWPKTSPEQKSEEKDPTLKYFSDKGVSVSESNPDKIKIEDSETNTIKKLSDYGTEKVSEFNEIRSTYIKGVLGKIKDGGVLYVDKYGRVSSTRDSGEEAVELDKLTDTQLKSVMSRIGSDATKKAKKDLFNQD